MQTIKIKLLQRRIPFWAGISEKLWIPNLSYLSHHYEQDRKNKAVK